MDDSLETTAHAFARWLVLRYPERGGAQLHGLRRSDGGYSNITLLGEVEWGDGDAREGFVLRVQPPTRSVFPDCDIERQYRVLRCLADSAVPVPRLLGLETGAGVLGAPFFVMQRVDGRVPNENPLYHLEGWFHDLPEEQLRAHWFSGIDTIAAISRIDWRARGLDFLAPAQGRTPLSAQLDHYRNAVLWAESLGRPYAHLHRAHAWLAAHQPQDEPVALSWGDAKLGNCVYRDGQVAAALDWEQAALANPVDDLAWWLMLDESMSTGYGVPRLTGLPTREETVAYWERVTGHSARDLPYYDVYAAWRMAYIMARIGTIFMERGWVAREAEMDLKNGGAALLAMHAQRLGF